MIHYIHLIARFLFASKGSCAFDNCHALQLLVPFLHNKPHTLNASESSTTYTQRSLTSHSSVPVQKACHSSHAWQFPDIVPLALLSSPSLGAASSQGVALPREQYGSQVSSLSTLYLGIQNQRSLSLLHGKHCNQSTLFLSKGSSKVYNIISPSPAICCRLRNKLLGDLCMCVTLVLQNNKLLSLQVEMFLVVTSFPH